jgi:hypothetical protein
MLLSDSPSLILHALETGLTLKAQPRLAAV